MNNMFNTLKLSDLDIKKYKILRNPTSTRPTLWLVEANGKRAVVKDFSRNRFFFRNIIGRFLIWREKKAYSRLTGVQNIPTLYHSIDGVALVLEQVQGKTLGKLDKKAGLPEDFFQELRNLLDKVHKRGIVHCDLKTSTNILLGRDKKPYLIDWAASISKREFKVFPLNLIYNQFLKDDFMAVVKHQIRYLPDSVTPEQRRDYYHQSKQEKIIRSIRNRLRQMLQKIS